MSEHDLMSLVLGPQMSLRRIQRIHADVPVLPFLEGSPVSCVRWVRRTRAQAMVETL